jgi:type II secretory pathway pseudopilin PulG
MKATDRQLASDNKSAGFTIIETLMVLGIAGLILLIVFLAIPALERNSRNNQRRQDIQTVLAAVSHWELNNSGNIPQWSGGAGDNFLQYYKSQLTYYDPSSVTVTGISARTSLLPHDPNSNLDTVYIYNYQKCGSIGGRSTWQGAGYSDVVALYAIETGNAVITPECQQL